MQTIIAQSNRQPKRDATGKFVPLNAEKWIARMEQRAESREQRTERLVTTYGAWAAETGTSLVELEAMFA